MTETPKKVRFYYDFISPYAYLGWVELQRFVAQTEIEVEVEPIPILFAGLLNHWGQKGPAEIPAKRAFTFQDVFRRGARIGLELDFPSTHPFNPLLPLRVMISIENDPQRNRALGGIFEACWQRQTDITDATELREVLERYAISEISRHLEQSQSAEIKDRLRQNTQDAIDAGVFGVPTFGIGDTLLWGSDQLDFVKMCLSGEDPAERCDQDALSQLKASASRT